MSDNPQALVLTELQNRVLRLRLNRANKKNSLTQVMYQQLADMIREADANDQVRVLVIEGSGDSFSAGNDMVDFMKAPNGSGNSPVIQFMNALAHFSKPAIASVNGIAVGVGVTLLLHCDLVYASSQAKFQLPFVSIGIVPEYASTYLLPRIMGHARAMELCMFGEPFTAEHARECGLVNEVLEPDALAARVTERAEKLAAQPPNALRTCKQLSKRWTRNTIDEAIPLESFHFVPMLHQEEAKEAIGAFLEKRKPDFSRF